MNKSYTGVVKTAQEYYNSDDADNFYFNIWGGEDIHIGLYNNEDEDISVASERTVATLASKLNNLNKHANVVDLGAGYGGAARWLHKHYDCSVSCINLSEAQNYRNRSINEANDLSDHIEVIDGSFEELTFKNGSFDVAWSQDAILHSGQRERVLHEVNRVLKAGGEFIFTDPMQADNCPDGVLQPVLDRIHLETLGSFKFYQSVANKIGWETISIEDITPQLIRHYTRVKEELYSRKNELEKKVSVQYIERMIQGLSHWINAGEKGYLAWGILHFRKPA